MPARRTLELRLVKGFRIGGSQLGIFVDSRNAFDFRNVIRVFSVNAKVSNPTERTIARLVARDGFAAEAQRNGRLLPDSSVDLSFGGLSDPRAGCGGWTRQGGGPSPPNCLYLIQTGRRFGNGDAIFTVAEQTCAADAYYDVARGLQHFTGPGRRVRVGVQASF